jgi:hypothetical protein
MSQTFHHSMNTVARVSIYGAVFAAAGLGYAWWTILPSPYVSEVGLTRAQPVPFSHKHHAGDLGIDCRYCHTTVDVSSFAGIPPTKTCMTCHSQIWTNADMLEPVRESFRTDKSIEWTRVHDLPDFVYFDHSIHVNKGIGCSTCHGRVDEMPLMFRQNTLEMRWCLDCHRQPEKYIRPRDKIYDMTWQPPPDQLEQGRKLLEQYQVKTTDNRMIDCWICHR